MSTHTERTVVAAGWAVLALVLAPALAGAPAHALAQPLPTTCQGSPATVVSNASAVQGTEGDDVIVAGVTSYGRLDALGGDDLVCLVDGAPPRQSRDVGYFVDTGAGDDSVTNEQTSIVSRLVTTLGEGADRYVGNAASESVAAGMVVSVPLEPEVEVDVISTGGGDDTIISGGDGSAANPDVLDTGTGRDRVVLGGVAAPGSELTNGGGADQLEWLLAGVTGAVALDAVTGSALVDGVPALRWTDVDSYEVAAPRAASLAFAGSTGDEFVSLERSTASGPPVDLDVDLSGGNDYLALATGVSGRVEGGGGHDTLDVSAVVACQDPCREGGPPAKCQRMVLRLAGHLTCGSDASLPTALGGFERSFATGTTSVLVVGTARGDDVRASARRATVRGRGGADTVELEGHGRRGYLTAFGGAGRDRITGTPYADTLAGGPGADLLRGGPGADLLRGGLGRDRAHGGMARDTCRAEVRRGCEIS